MSAKAFNKYSVAPDGARSVGVFDGDGRLRATFPLGGLRGPQGTPLYRFGVLADTHQNPSQASTDENLADFRNALSVMSQVENVDYVCVLGDVTTNGCATAAQISCYANAVSASNVAPTYALAGNHDCQNGFTTTSLANWQNFTVSYVKGSYKEQSTPDVTYTTSKLAYYFRRLVPGTLDKYDYFIFLGMNTNSFSSNIFLSEDLQFVQNLITGEASSSRCFVFLHPFFTRMAGDFQSLYSQSNRLQGSQAATLLSLMNGHQNSIWFSGHSHWKQYLADMEPSENSFAGVYSNIWHEQASGGGWTVHVASCAYPRDAHYDTTQQKWVSDASQSWTSKASEGMVVDVYEDHVNIRGMSFKDAWSDGSGDVGYVTRLQPAGTFSVPVGGGSPTPSDANTEIYDMSGIKHVVVHPMQGGPLDNDLLIQSGLKTNAYTWSIIPLTAIVGSRATSIGSWAFYSTSLQRIEIPSGVKSIGENAFAHCDILESVTIPSSVTSIGDSAFYGCTSLQGVTIPQDIVTIDLGAFCGCDSLQTVYAETAQLMTMDYVADNALGWGLGINAYGNTFTVVVHCYDGILVLNGESESSGGGGGGGGEYEETHVTYASQCGLPDWTGRIEGSLYYHSIPDSAYIETATLNEGISEILQDVFQYNGNLEYIRIPKTVTYIYESTFSGCTSLQSVDAPGMTMQYVADNALQWGLGYDYMSGLTFTVVVHCSDGVLVLNGESGSSGEMEMSPVDIETDNGM